MEQILQPGHEGNIGEVVAADVEFRETAKSGQDFHVRADIVVRMQGNERARQVGHRRNIGEVIIVYFQVPNVRQAVQETQVRDPAIIQQQSLQRGQAAEEVCVGDQIVVEFQVTQVGGQLKPFHAGDPLIVRLQARQAGKVRLVNRACRNSNGGAHRRLEIRVVELREDIDAQLRRVAVNLLPEVLGNDHKVTSHVRAAHIGDRQRVGQRAADAAVGRVSQGSVVEIPLVIDVRWRRRSRRHREHGCLAAVQAQIRRLAVDDGGGILRQVSEVHAAANQSIDNIRGRRAASQIEGVAAHVDRLRVDQVGQRVDVGDQVVVQVQSGKVGQPVQRVQAVNAVAAQVELPHIVQPGQRRDV